MSYVIPRPARVQIYGERCSGTNYVAELLRRGARVRCLLRKNPVPC